MKLKGILFLLICFSLQSKAQKVKDVFISGRIVNFNNRTNVIDLSEIAPLSPPNNDREIAPDSAGSFSVHFKLRVANYFEIGQNILYLTPGDRMKVMIDYQSPEKSTFLGSSSTASYYLESTPFPHAGSYLGEVAILKLTLQENINLILSLAQKRRNKLDSLHNLPRKFVDLEKGRINADIINSFKALPGLFIRARKIHNRDDQIKIFKETDSLTRPYLLTYSSSLHKASFLQLEVVRNNFYRIMDGLENTSPDAPKIRDWQYAYELVYAINAAKDREELLKLEVKIDSIKNSKYREAVKNSFDLQVNFREGDTAKDFQSISRDNQAVALSSFKGKIIYIDFWATWCVPCLQEMPFLDNLRKIYSGNPNIIFISICINNNIDDWKKNLIKRNPEGLQLIAQLSQILPYKLTTIPRAIIIDKDFKILMMNALMPSNPGLQPYLDKLLSR